MKTLLRPSLVVIGLTALTCSAFFSLTNPAAAADATVPVGNFFFCSSASQGATCTTTVNVGDTVTWDFSGASAPHTTSSGSGGWDSGTVSPGGSFQHTFAQAGSFSYVCNIHPTLMMGTVVVQAAAAASPTSPPSGGTPSAATSTPVAGATATAGSGLPPTGQGPQSGDTNGWLLAGLAIVGLTFVGSGLALARRTS